MFNYHILVVMKRFFLFAIILATTLLSCMAQDVIIPRQISGEIQLYVDLFSHRRRNMTDAMLSRSYVYSPIIKNCLERYQMPQWLEYMPMVESTLITTAKTNSGRMGLWMLTPSMAKEHGLVINDDVNECFDPVLATEVACERLKEFHDYYDDWLLAVAAYNTAQSTVDGAISRADGHRDYFAIHQYLPLETRGFVPALLAISYVMNHPEEFDLKPMCGVEIWSDSEEITVMDSLSFSRVSTSLGIFMEEICRLNPKYVKKRIPVSTGEGYRFRLPKCYSEQFRQTFKSVIL